MSHALPDLAARVRRWIQRASGSHDTSRRAETHLDSAAALDRHSDSFESLAVALFGVQFEHNSAYRRFCQARHCSPSTIRHWSRVPALPASAFKDLEPTCLPVEARTAVFHSSGTTGQRPSRHFHSADSLRLYESSLLPWFLSHCPLRIAACRRNIGTGPANDLTSERMGLGILTPPRHQAPASSLVYMFDTIRRAVGQGEAAFLGRVEADGAWAVDFGQARQLLERATAGGQPLLLLGTAFSFVHLLDDLVREGLSFSLPHGSWVLETGGYKGRSRRLGKIQLHALITERFGVPAHRIICEYGMSELGSQAYARAASSGHARTRVVSAFHFPHWARVQIVSPETGAEVGEGETGLIRVFDLANVYSVMAIQTEDLGIRRGRGFELIGRAPEAEPRGCSLMALAEAGE